MLSPTELLKKIQTIEIKSQKLSTMVFSGEYNSRFKGRGMNFSEVRDYEKGDDIRAIDWNVTARYNKPYVKLFEEEKEMTVMLIVDTSASGFFGTKEQFKQELSVEISALLAFSAIKNKDNIGVLFFSDKVEKLIAPKKGKKHVLRIVRELLALEPSKTKTGIGDALKHFNNFQSKRCIVFLVSDFLDNQYEEALKVVNKRHDLLCVKVNDKREYEMPDVGFARFQDLETGQEVLIDTSSRKIRQTYEKTRKDFNDFTENILKKNGIKFANVYTGEPYILELISLFERKR